MKRPTKAFIARFINTHTGEIRIKTYYTKMGIPRKERYKMESQFGFDVIEIVDIKTIREVITALIRERDGILRKKGIYTDYQKISNAHHRLSVIHNNLAYLFQILENEGDLQC